MDGEILTWVFLIGGVLLMLLEMAVPTGIAITLGFSGLLIGVLRLFGLFEDPAMATMSWLFISVALTIIIRPIIRRYFPGETSFKVADEDYEAMDQIVEVVEAVNEQNNDGRIRYQGISWQARSLDGEIPAGTKVRIKYRENTTWIVEPVQQISGQDQRKLKE